MSMLNGGLPKKANESIEDFVAEFIDLINDDEWVVTRSLAAPVVDTLNGFRAAPPQLRDVLQLVAVIVWVRTQNLVVAS